MDRETRLQLEQQAQGKLADARRLIKEAGALAKEGKFVLEFGEIGTFIPKGYNDPELYREEALEELKTKGWSYYDSQKKGYVETPWSELEANPELLAEALDNTIEGFIDSLEVPWEYREYGGGAGTDTWWHPSRC